MCVVCVTTSTCVLVPAVEWFVVEIFQIHGYVIVALEP